MNYSVKWKDFFFIHKQLELNFKQFSMTHRSPLMIKKKQLYLKVNNLLTNEVTIKYDACY